jgi:hypothetical protein
MGLRTKIKVFAILLEKQYQLGLDSNALKDEWHEFQVFFEALGQQKKAFLKLSERIQSYSRNEGSQRFDAYLKISFSVQRLSINLALTGKDEGSKELQFYDEDIVYRNDSWFTLKPIMKALSIKGSGRLKALENAYLLRFYQNRQLLPYLIDAAGDSYSAISELVLKEMLPFFGRAGEDLLFRSLDLSGGRSEQNKLVYLLGALQGEELKVLQLRVFESGSLEFKKTMLRTCEPQEWMKAELGKLENSRSSELVALIQGAFEKLG